MKLNESTAWQCRWFECVGPEYAECPVLLDLSENDWQGSVCVIFQTPSKGYGFIQYDYGSCSGCDEYECMNEEDVGPAILRGGGFFDTKEELLAFAGKVLFLNRYIDVLEQFAPESPKLKEAIARRGWN